MAVAETARLVVDLSLKGNFSRQLQQSGRALGKFDARLDKTESRAFRAGQQIGTGLKRGAIAVGVGVGFVASQVALGLDSLIELEKQTAQTNAVLKSTKGVAGITADEVTRLSEKYESLNATVGDEFIRAAQNMLLTFTNIREKAFEPTLKQVLNLNTALGLGPESLTKTAIQVGKALQDPVRGLTALRRVGISFTKAQEKRIKALVKEGKTYEAQRIILHELNTEFGKSFTAQGATTAGKVAKFTDSIEDLQRTLASGLLPVVSNVADALSALFQDPAVKAGVDAFGKDLAKVLSPANIREGIGALKDIATVIAPGFRIAGSAIGLMIDAFNKIPPDLRNLLIAGFAINKATSGLLTNIAGGLASAIGGALKTIYAAHVTVIGPGGGPPMPPTSGGGKPTPRPNPLETARSNTRSGLRNLRTGGGGGFTPGAGIVITGDLLRTANSKLDGILQAARANKLPTPLPVTGRTGGMSPDERQAVNDQKRRIAEVAMTVHRQGERQRQTVAQAKAAIDASKQRLAAVQAETKRETSRGVVATQAAKSATTTGASRIVGATNAQTSAIVGALYATRVTVQSVTKNTTIVQRYGPSNGSSGRFGQ